MKTKDVFIVFDQERALPREAAGPRLEVMLLLYGGVREKHHHLLLLKASVAWCPFRAPDHIKPDGFNPHGMPDNPSNSSDRNNPQLANRFHYSLTGAC